MTQYIVRIKYEPKSIFDKGWMKIRFNAPTEELAAREVVKHSLFPPDGTIIEIKRAAYSKKYNPK